MAKSPPKKKPDPRKILLFVWGGGCLLNLALLFFWYLDGWMEADSFKAGLKMINAVYAPYLGMMLFFYWARGKAKRVKRGVPFTLALVAGVVWNGVILSFLLLLPIEDAVAGITDFAALLSWLVAGAIGYYFARGDA